MAFLTPDSPKTPMEGSGINLAQEFSTKQEFESIPVLNQAPQTGIK